MSAKTLLSALLFTVFFFVLQSSYAQDKTVTGKVTDSKDGTPVVGASVVAKGTTNGTSTNKDGNFSLLVPSSASTLVITSVGYDAFEVSIAGRSSVTISLQTQTGGLSEVVVIGYGTAGKEI